MVWQQALYLVNLLCKFVPCDYNFPPPDTSLSEPQAFKDLITLGFDSKDKDNPGGNSLKIGHGEGWAEQGEEIDYTGADPLVAITATGKLRGYWMRVVGGRKIRAFEGIPYAEPPTGYFRFAEPSPKIPWSGLLWANKKGPKCLQFSQIELKRIVGSEDCLCLNIYAPKIHPPPVSSSPKGRAAQEGAGSRYPVLIFIHGGGFQVGAGNDYGPSYLLQQDVILVTFNYRVGVFGFMSTGDKISPGNYGLKDQALAIQWVVDNIAVFHGDPSRITLVGQEAGGASVHLQMLRGGTLPFSGGISMSGTAFNSWVFCSKEAAHKLAKYFAKKFSCPVHTSAAITSCLRRVDAGDLAKAQIHFLDDLPIPLYLFRPVLEEPGGKEPPFITQSPETLYRTGAVARIPWIAGFTEDEGLTFLLPSVFRGSIKHLRANWNSLAPDLLDYQDLTGVDVEDVTKKINWLYFKQKTPHTATIKTFSDAISLRFTVTGVHKGLQAHSTLAPTYAYMFSYNGNYNLATLAGIKPHEWGVGQGEDLFYLLNSTHFYQGFGKADHEMILSKIMVNLFSNFASKGYPTFTMENHEDFGIWSPITDPRNMSFLLIHKKIRMIPEPYLKQSVYWESIGLPDTTAYINSSEHYKDYHFMIGSQPSSRGQTPLLGSGRGSGFHGNGVIPGFATPDIFSLRNNLSLRSSPVVRGIKEDKPVEQVELQNDEVEELQGIKEHREGEGTESLSTPSTEMDTVTSTPSYDPDSLFLPPWNPYGVLGVGTSPVSPKEMEEISTTTPSRGSHGDEEDSFSITPSPALVEEDPTPEPPLENGKQTSEELSQFGDSNGLDKDDVNGHQNPEPPVNLDEEAPILPNSLDLLNNLGDGDDSSPPDGSPVDMNEEQVTSTSTTPVPNEVVELSTTTQPVEGEVGKSPKGVEEAEIEKFSLFEFKPGQSPPYSNAYEDSEESKEEAKPTKESEPTTPISVALPVSSTTSSPPPRVLYPSRYHSPHVAAQFLDDAPYNIMK